MLESILLRILTGLMQRLPEEHSVWCKALIAEAAEIHKSGERLRWMTGGVVVALRTYALNRIDAVTTDLDGKRLPAMVLIIASYQVLFSLVLVGLLTFQLGLVRESWTDALPVLLIAFFVAIVPGVLGFGLLILDDAARWGTLVFSIAHALLAFHRLSTAPVSPTLPTMRIVFDAFIIAILLCPVIRRRFQDRALQLNLR